MKRGTRSPNVVILAHGGAGMRVVTAAQRACLAEALAAGHAVLRRGGPAVTAVEAAIKVMEGSGLFNAGTGAHLQLDGARRMDASIMDGLALRAGAVAGVERIRHPISAARLVMEKTAHVLLIGTHATRLARHFKLDRFLPSINKAPRVAKPATEAQRRTLRLYQATLSQSLSPGGSNCVGCQGAKYVLRSSS